MQFYEHLTVCAALHCRLPVCV